MKYFGDWKTAEDVYKDFSGTRWSSDREQTIEDFPKAAEVLFACYTYADYSGTAFVLFRRGGKLFEVNGGHCSCYGLEGQWSPEETSKEALEMRTWTYGVEDPAGKARLLRIIAGL